MGRPTKAQKLINDAKKASLLSQPDKAEVINVPGNKAAWIAQRSESFRNGDLTVYDIGNELGLTGKQIKFAVAFASPETFWSGVEAAMIAYEYSPKQRGTAAYTASMNGKNEKIQTLINILLDSEGVNANNIDKQMLQIMQQKNDPKAAVMAANILNGVLGRNVKKIEVTHISPKYDFNLLSPEESFELRRLLQKSKLKEIG